MEYEITPPNSIKTLIRYARARTIEGTKESYRMWSSGLMDDTFIGAVGLLGTPLMPVFGIVEGIFEWRKNSKKFDPKQNLEGNL